MTWQIFLFLSAGVMAGIVNVAAGGAKLFLFPMLIAAGLPPLVANATGTLAVWPALLPAIYVYRSEFRGKARALSLQMAPALAGAVVGAIALIWSSESAFVSVIPFLLIIAVSAILLGNRLAVLAQRIFPGGRMKSVTGVLMFGTGCYAGYFGAGFGFILLAILSIAGLGMREANITKNLFGFAMNSAALIPLMFSGLIEPVAAGFVVIGAFLGGYLGARLTMIVSDTWLRAGVSIIGVVLTASFLFR